jgi:flagellin
MFINHNMSSMNTYRQLKENSSAKSKNLEKLSLGLRINRAGDDAAGLSISEKMRGQIRGMQKAFENAQDGFLLVKTADRALSETEDMLQRMRELAVQASNATNVVTDRVSAQAEMNQLIDEIDRIAHNTEHNTHKLLNGDQAGQAEKIEGSITLKDSITAHVEVSALMREQLDAINKSGVIMITRTNAGSSDFKDDFKLIDPYSLKSSVTGIGSTGLQITGISGLSAIEINGLNEMKVGESVSLVVNKMEDGKSDITKGFALQIGANTGQTMLVDINDMSAGSLGVRDSNGKPISLADEELSSIAITVIDQAIEKVATQRAHLGAFENRLENTMKNLENSAYNLQASETHIRDTDIAKEMIDYTKNSVMEQASRAISAQANQIPERVLEILRN